MTKYGSYQFEKLEGRHQEAHRLAERAQMRMQGFPQLLLRHKYPSEGQVLEIGTAQGLRARLMAEQFPHSKVIGIDRSEELLAEAIHTHREITNLEFHQADVYDLPYADNSFDFIYARLVFMHLTDPMKALNSMKRVLKPGGHILIEDADRDCMFFEPAPPSLRSFWNQVQDGQRRLGGDPNVGRKLASYYSQLGLSQINIEVQTILGKGAEIEFLVRTLLPSLNTYLPPEARPQGKRAIQDLHELSQNPNAQFYHFWFAVSGQKSL